MSDCVFCEIVRDDPHSQVLQRRKNTVVFEPLSPVTPGHLLVVPRSHVEGPLSVPMVTADTFHDAAIVGAQMGLNRSVGANLIASHGTAATQTVFHFHVHVIPRRTGDGLRLPWSTA